MASNRHGIIRTRGASARFDEAHLTGRAVILAMRERQERLARRRRLIADLRSGWLSVWRFFGRNRAVTMQSRFDQEG